MVHIDTGPSGMALAQYRNEVAGVEKTRRLGAPKLATQKGWYRAVRKVIPEVPDVKNSDWTIYTYQAGIKWIRFDFVNSVGERAYLVIDRSVPSI